jgi:hypothetical protein
MSLQLEISFFSAEANRYRLELRFQDPANEAERSRVWGECEIDYQHLLTLESDPPAYGHALAEALFKDPNIRREYDHAQSVFGSSRESGFLRLKLSFDASAEQLQGLRWELLTDPNDNHGLATSENILFSRFIQSLDWRAVRLQPRAELKALIAVAAPSNLADYGLADIDVESEITRVSHALEGIEVVELGNVQPVTLNRLITELREQAVDILYLVCHGTLRQRPEEQRDPARLFLQNEDGTVKAVAGVELVKRLQELQRQPRLIVLASCESAGTPQDAILRSGEARASLAPRLAAAGVPAILAMRGKITMATAEQAMPVFFRELLRDGQIDRAMAVARGQVRERPDSWMLALFLRLRDGRLWYEPQFARFAGDKKERERELEQWKSICSFTQKGEIVPILGPDLAEHIYGSSWELAQELAAKHSFPLSEYDQTDLAKVTQYISTNNSPAAAWAAVEDELNSKIKQKFQALAGLEIPAEANDPWPFLIDELWKSENDPCRMLAELNAGIYVSANAILPWEKFLKKKGKEPKLLITEWRDERRAEFEFHGDPTPGKPYVYYVYGRALVKDTWVLTEDDFFDYLIRTSLYHTLLPDVIGKALTSNSLLFLGFSLEDWKFRILLRMIMAKGGSSRLQRYNHVGVQVDPGCHTLQDVERFKYYMERYFVPLKIDIFWGSATDFLKELKVQCQKLS